MTMPFQKALKLPATRPERIVSDAPPSRDAVTISATCLDLRRGEDLGELRNHRGGQVPQLMIVESFHQTCRRPCRR